MNKYIVCIWVSGGFCITFAIGKSFQPPTGSNPATVKLQRRSNAFILIECVSVFSDDQRNGTREKERRGNPITTGNLETNHPNPDGDSHQMRFAHIVHVPCVFSCVFVCVCWNSEQEKQRKHTNPKEKKNSVSVDDISRERKINHFTALYSNCLIATIILSIFTLL